MPFIRIWVHLIWSTKNREKIIPSEMKNILIEHIKGVWLDSINCVSDHIHLLISLNAEMPISKLVMLIKGESSHWINKNKLIRGKFQWQEEYIALSVSESIIPKVRDYIKNQEEHHRRITFSEEYDDFMKKYGVKIIQK